MAKKQIKDYRFVPGVVPPDANQYPNAVALIESNRTYIIEEVMGYLTFATGTPSYAPNAANSAPYTIALLTANKEFIKEEANAWILRQISSSTSPFVGYVYDTTKQAKCKRDIGYLIDAFVADLTGGGNAETIRIGRMFYLNGEAQLLNPVQEAAVHTFVKTLMENYVLAKVGYTSDQSPIVAAQVTTGTIAETFAVTKVNTLNNIVINLITTGLSSLPAISYNFNAVFAEYVYGATKCKRDVGYVLDAVAFDIALQTNYNGVFIGLAESNSLDLSQTVIDTINASKTQVLALSAVSGSAPAVTKVNSDYTEILNIAQNGYTVASAVTFTNPGTQTASLIAVKDKLVANKTFIQNEINAWVNVNYPLHDHNVTKCSRDVGFAVDAFCYDMLYGGNSATYDQAKFFFYSGASGITDAHKAQTVAAYGRLKTIIGQIVQGVSVTRSTGNVTVQVTSGTNAGGTDAASVQSLAQIVADVVNNGSSSLPGTRTTPDVTWSTTALKNAKSAIEAAKTTIQNTVVTYSDYTYDQAKCRRDSAYIVDSVLHDMSYGGNSSAYYVAARYQIGGVPQVNRPQVEVLSQTFAKELVQNYILLQKYHASYQWDFYQTVTQVTMETSASAKAGSLYDVIINTISNGLSALPAVVPPNGLGGNLLPNAIALLEANKKYIQEEAIAFIQYGIDNNVPPYVYYTYNAAKCRRDVSYIIEGYITDLSHGGNRQTVFNASKYWENGIAQVDGDRQPEIYAHTFIRDLIENYIFTNTSFTSRQTVASQVKLNNITVEVFAEVRVKELSNTILDVIQYGITYLPATVSNRGYIKAIGFYKLKDFLLVTNTSRNTILYNFADTNAGGEVTYSENFDSDFPAFLNVADKVTTLTFDADTSGHMVTDNIQIFVEGPYQTVRLNSVATDAMERSKVGLPQSMLDADFEYGLQPTKWQAISMMRNYPAIYELPGTDLAVLTVTTDASNGTAGVGASLLTVTTSGAHGFVTGTPFTIKALANTILGFSRAEGSFLVNSVPDLYTFTYYAKARVGTSNGQLLASTYTQLRKGNFYTGASVGTPSFSVASNGSSGNITTSLVTPSGATFLGVASFSGGAPSLGAPITGTGIATGSQVTAVTGSGGNVASTKLIVTAESGASSLTVVDTTGIVGGLVFDRGDGRAIQVTNVIGAVVNLTGTLTSRILGTTATYTSLSAATNSGTGTSAVFSISRNNTVYAGTATNPGAGYQVNDVLTFLGSSLDGVNTTNDATMTVATATLLSPVTAFNAATLVAGFGYSTTQGLATTTTGAGSGLTVDITFDGGGSVLTVSVNNGGGGYSVGDVITISGGVTPATIQVLTVAVGGQILTLTGSGTPVTAPTRNFISSVTINTATTADITAASTIPYTAIATIQVDFASAHGFVPGNSITVDISSTGTNHALAAGPYYVEAVPTATRIRYTARTAGTVDTGSSLIGTVYARPDSYYVHRPFDGGVQLGTGGPQHAATAIRMSKKYIRYQSGKGVSYNTGALFAPSYDLRSMTATGLTAGSYITIATDDTDHGCQIGAQVTISGSLTSGYNGVFTVISIIDERAFVVQAQLPLGALSAVLDSPCQMAVRTWQGATVRAGTFDDQNGMFWQYDGRQMGVGKRSSTFQIAGTISVNSNSNAITGTSTRFTQQLAAGDRIVIRGMTHIVSNVFSDTSCTVTPDFRGAINVSNVKVCKTIDQIIPQEYWDLDPCNGSGPSGFNIDVTKMQMIGMQWTWYGSGFIDFMLRGADGNYVFAHRIRNSNVNTEAYMRTGNMPVRYEVINESAKGVLTAPMTINQTTISMSTDDLYWFPNSGTVMIDQEMISYTGNSGTALTGCTRAAQLTQFVSGAQRNFSGGVAATHTTRSGVILISNTVTPIISHWGSAFMTDGRFDEDRGYIFNYVATNVSISTTKATAFLIRLAPSVSNAIVGDLGERELINRAQLLLKGIEITADTGTGGLVIEGVLNPQNYPVSPTDITWTGLQASAQGGQPSFAQIAAGGSVNWNGGASSTTSAATTQSAMTGSLTARAVLNASGNIATTGTNSMFLGKNYFYVLDTDWISYNASGWAVGDAISGTGIPANTTISAIAGSATLNGTTNYYLVTMSANANATVSGANSITVTRSFKTSTTSTIFFQNASFVATTAKAGTEVSDALFPANTFISTATAVTFFGTTYYRVNFTQTSTSTTITPGTTTITFKFGQPAYAQPGETVFSFIAAPGATSSLDLGELKELTNTTLGGRGAFPNGPDVLAINIYKTSGTAIVSNVIIRWGEAQA